MNWDIWLSDWKPIFMKFLSMYKIAVSDVKVIGKTHENLNLFLIQNTGLNMKIFIYTVSYSLPMLEMQLQFDILVRPTLQSFDESSQTMSGGPSHTTSTEDRWYTIKNSIRIKLIILNNQKCSYNAILNISDKKDKDLTELRERGIPN